MPLDDGASASLVHRVLQELTQLTRGITASGYIPIMARVAVYLCERGILRFGIFGIWTPGIALIIPVTVYRVDKSVNHSETKPSTPFYGTSERPPIALPIDTPTLPKYQPHRSRPRTSPLILQIHNYSIQAPLNLHQTNRPTLNTPKLLPPHMLPNHRQYSPAAHNRFQAPVNIPPKNCTTGVNVIR